MTRVRNIAPGVAELHLHLEGSLTPESAVELARRSGHPWGELTAAELRATFRYDSFADFLDRIREMCRVLNSLPALERAAFELSRFEARHGIEYAEVYVSPWIYARWGLDYDDVMNAVVAGFDRGKACGGADCRILLDTVRQWGPEAAHSILDHHQKSPRRQVVGFGIGGEESVPLQQFVEVFEKARSLGLRTVAHAGETGPASDVRTAIEDLHADRIAHGIRALDQPELVTTIVRKGIPLDLAITSNYRTKAVRRMPHPVRQLLDRGVMVTLSTDDPSLFRTDPVRESERARRFGSLSPEELTGLARNAIRASFAPEEVRRQLDRILDSRLQSTGHGKVHCS